MSSPDFSKALQGASWVMRSGDVADPFLARLREPKHPAFEFTFGLEPIVQLAAWLFAASEIDFVCAASDFLFTLRVPC
jgi:hypothetical protein